MTTKERKPARLVDIQLSELSLVDRPANPHARVTLFKRADDEQRMRWNCERSVTTGLRASGTLEEAMAHLQTVSGMSTAAAMSKAAREHPELVEKYRRQGDAQMAKAADAARPQPVNKAILGFDDKVDEIAKARGLPRHAAMSAARERHPEEFQAAYGD